MNRRPPSPHSRRNERGSMTPGLVVLATGLLLVIGLVVDGSRGLNAIDQAGDIAAQAAHAAGQQLDAPGFQQGAGANVNVAAAVAVAQNVISAGGATGSVSVQGDHILIETTVTKPSAFLSLISIPQVHGTGTAVVRLALGEQP